MEISEAQAHVAVQNPLQVDELHAELSEHHEGDPRKLMMLQHAIGALREGLAALASLGHRYEIVPHAPGTSTVRFPQMLYMARAGGVDEMTVESQDEYDAACGAGWVESPSGQA